MRNQLTQDEIKKRLDYEPLTGKLIWKPKPVLHKWDKIWNTRFSGKTAGSLDKRHAKRIVVKIEGVGHFAHRLIWCLMTGEWPFEIDHKDHDGSNNRWDNLREANDSQNQWNKRRQINNKSGYKGVSFQKKSNKWAAFIKKNGKSNYLGLFDTPENAHIAYREAAKNLHNDFACTGELDEKIN